MQVQRISNKNNYFQNFGLKFRLSEETIKAAEKSTGLTYKEMTSLSFSEIEKLMQERGTLKKPNKLKIWLADKYRKFGEYFGLLEKKHNIYTDID